MKEDMSIVGSILILLIYVSIFCTLAGLVLCACSVEWAGDFFKISAIVFCICTLFLLGCVHFATNNK